MNPIAKAKELMLKEHLKGRGINNPLVLAAMESVPRESFVLPEYHEKAYQDRPLPIEENQTISQPYIVALMAQALEIKPNDQILDVGSGSGYAAAVFSRLAKQVYGIEYFQRLADSASLRLSELGYTNVFIKQGDGRLGWKKHAPYQGIAVAAAAAAIPEELLKELAINGRLVVPLEEADGSQRLVRVIKIGEGRYSYQDLGGVCFVPFL